MRYILGRPTIRQPEQYQVCSHNTRHCRAARTKRPWAAFLQWLSALSFYPFDGQRLDDSWTCCKSILAFWKRPTRIRREFSSSICCRAWCSGPWSFRRFPRCEASARTRIQGGRHLQTMTDLCPLPLWLRLRNVLWFPVWSAVSPTGPEGTYFSLFGWIGFNFKNS